MCVSEGVHVCVCARAFHPPAASGVVLLHVFDEVDLLRVSRSWGTSREVSYPSDTQTGTIQFVVSVRVNKRNTAELKHLICVCVCVC